MGFQQAHGAKQGLCGSHGCGGCAAWLGNAACSRGIELCKGRVLALFHSGIAPGGTLIISVYLHTGAGLTQENWQILSTIGQWLTSQALPFVIGGDFQVEPAQLEDSGWVRAIGGFVVAPQLATVTPSHRVIDFFVVSRDLAGACQATTHISPHIAPHRPVKLVVSAQLVQPFQSVMSRPRPWPVVRPSGCRRTQCGLDWDAVRCSVQEAERPQAGWQAFIEAVEEELIDAFLIADDVAGTYRGRAKGQRLVLKACKSPWCDNFPRGSRELQAWRRKSRVCKDILTVRRRLDEALCEGTPADGARVQGLAHELMTLARQAHKLAAAPSAWIPCARRRSFWQKRLRTIAEQPAWMVQLMEAEAADLADRALRVQQHAARKAWRAWLDEHTIAGAAKVHQMIREPIGFQAARGNRVDEQLKLREEWAGIRQASASSPALIWPACDEQPYHRPSFAQQRAWAMMQCHRGP